MHAMPVVAPRPCARVALLGLDGLSLDIARAIAAFGRTPHLAALCQDPRTTTVDAELPELSPVNWTSLATGEGPEVHGVYGFTRINPATYAITIGDSRQVRLPTIFDQLTRHGRVCRVLNLPGLWPVRPRSGMPDTPSTLIAGFIAPSLEDAVHPPALVGELRRAGYRIEADTLRGAADPAYLLAQLRETLRGRRLLLQRFLAPGDFHCLCCVFTETDRLFHFLLPAVLEADHPWHPACLAFLEEWDAAVGLFFRMAKALPGETRILVMADHGFAPLHTEFDVNAWLRSQGLLLQEERPAASSGNGLDAGTIRHGAAAFALDPGRIHLHRRDIYARGSVTPTQEPALLERIRTGLLALRWNGQPVMEDVFLGRDLYPGDHSPDRPDLVCLSRPGVDLKAKWDRRELFGLYGRHGMHTARGAIFYDSLGQTPPRRMREVGRLLLESGQAGGLLT
ncbi:putative type I phosphodiesterase/nucleotide pyrophosphatase [Megalodesulfovibrio gigas DSM 1382 = ATCC 19364]|uniref:Putative type I phosphodiesterase/nucleotide pyrophosphatase n=2 Tax=Megalodesulfovibrio gigas TaxID=879 RepID=T2G764_MEGG1|nr:putative type I phosphodiesterase/nucleotide pyrophosphatase [Megalodesulfovibrio gigas DSM 1382 = ATCC 19364]